MQDGSAAHLADALSGKLTDQHTLPLDRFPPGSVGHEFARPSQLSCHRNTQSLAHGMSDCLGIVPQMCPQGEIRRLVPQLGVEMNRNAAPLDQPADSNPQFRPLGPGPNARQAAILRRQRWKCGRGRQGKDAERAVIELRKRFGLAKRGLRFAFFPSAQGINRTLDSLRSLLAGKASLFPRPYEQGRIHHRWNCRRHLALNLRLPSEKSGRQP